MRIVKSLMGLATAAAFSAKSTVRADNGTNVYGNVWIKAELDDSDSTQVKLTLRMESGTWLGLVLGSSGMASGSDMIQIDGTNEVAYDKVSAGYQYPSTDTTDDLTVAPFNNLGGGILEVTITRDLDTGDSQDYVIPADADFTMGWAINSVSDTLTEKHDQAGSFTLNLAEDEEEESESETEEEEEGFNVPGGALQSFGTLASVTATTICLLAL